MQGGVYYEEHTQGSVDCNNSQPDGSQWRRECPKVLLLTFLLLQSNCI